MRDRLAVRTNGQWVPRRDALAHAASGKAASAVNSALYAALAGLPDVAAELARRALVSPVALKVNAARYRNADYGEYMRLGDQASGSSAHALLRWIAEGALPRDEIARSVTLLEAAFEALHRFDRRPLDTVELDHYVRMAVLAKREDRALSMFRSQDRDRARPLIPEKARSERKVASLIAQYRVDGRAPDARLRTAVEKLIHQRIRGWLEGGRPSDLAVWLILRKDLDGRERSAPDVMGDAFDFMPGVPAP